MDTFEVYYWYQIEKEGEKMNEVRELKVMFNKSGGNASKNSYAPKLSIPKVWLDKMNVTLDEREVKAKFDGSKITIEKK